VSRKRVVGAGAAALAVSVVVLAVTPLGGAAVRHVSDLIAPTSKSAVAQINAGDNWQPSTFSRDGFSMVTNPEEGVYCLTGRANPDKSMLLLTVDAQHTILHGGTAEWDRSAPDCGPGQYEVLTFCPLASPVAPTPRQNVEGNLCNEVAFFAEAYVRA
jgi:hypothetical protein